MRQFEYHNWNGLEVFAKWWACYAYDALAQQNPADASIFRLVSLPTEAEVPDDPEQAIYPETQVSL